MAPTEETESDMTPQQSQNFGTGIVVAILMIPLTWFAYQMLDSGIIGTVAGSVAAQIDRIHQDHVERESAVMAFHDQDFKDVCPIYFQQSWFARHTNFRDFAWCHDYRDRFPAE